MGFNNSICDEVVPHKRSRKVSTRENGQSWKGSVEVKWKPLFIQLNELIQDETGNSEWKESARWIKFEETVERGGDRWSKPHVGSLSLHYVYEFKQLLSTCAIYLNLKAESLPEVCEKFLSEFVSKSQISWEEKTSIKKIIMSKHYHQFESNPHGNILRKISQVETDPARVPGSNSGTISSLIGQLQFGASPKLNNHFMKKIPQDAETANILVGEMEDLQHSICAFIRLQDPIKFPGITEVPVPTRFLFILLGPPEEERRHLHRYHEIGRTVGCLLSEEIFSSAAQLAQTREDLQQGLENFLPELTVLPPGKWDPTIRVEPPHIRSGSGDSPAINVENVREVEDEDYQLRKDAGLVRTGKFFGGFKNDVQRKAPLYWSDFRDAFSIQCVASYFFIYFACLAPIVTFGGLLGDATNNQMAAMESLMSGFVVGIGYALFSGQPLTIMGSTGPMLVFEALIFNFCENWEWDYLPFRLCIGLWVGILLFILIAFDASAYVCYITRFTEEIFALLISLIFIVQAFKNVLHISDNFPIQKTACFCQPTNDSIQVLVPAEIFTPYNLTHSAELHEDIYPCEFTLNGIEISGFQSPGCHYAPNVFLMSLLLFCGTFLTAFTLKKMKHLNFFPTFVRKIMADFAVIIAISLMTLIDFFVDVDTPKLIVPNNLRPTSETRGWLIHPLGSNPWWSSLLAIGPALLATILIFMDQQISTVIVNRKENKLLKGCGYHLDLFVVMILIIICSIFGLPWFVAATVLSVNHIKSLSLESKMSAPGEKPQFLGIREQRVTSLMIFSTIGLSIVLAPILRYIPMPVLHGVFLYMGIVSLNGLQFLNRLQLILMPKKYQPDYPFLRRVPVKRVHLFTAVQLGCFVVLWGIKSVEVTSIFFPIMLVVIIGARKILDFVFTKEELRILDDILPEFKRKQKLAEEEALEKENEERIRHQLEKIVVSNPAIDLLCTTSGIKLTLANGDVMTFPIEGDFKVNLSQDVKPTRSSNKEMTKFGFTLSEEIDDTKLVATRQEFDDILETPKRRKRPIIQTDLDSSNLEEIDELLDK